jgi:hypothetical protein
VGDQVHTRTKQKVKLWFARACTYTFWITLIFITFSKKLTYLYYQNQTPKVIPLCYRSKFIVAKILTLPRAENYFWWYFVKHSPYIKTFQIKVSEKIDKNQFEPNVHCYIWQAWTKIKFVLQILVQIHNTKLRRWNTWDAK